MGEPPCYRHRSPPCRGLHSLQCGDGNLPHLLLLDLRSSATHTFDSLKKERERTVVDNHNTAKWLINRCELCISQLLSHLFFDHPLGIFAPLKTSGDRT